MAPAQAPHRPLLEIALALGLGGVLASARPATVACCALAGGALALATRQLRSRSPAPAIAMAPAQGNPTGAQRREANRTSSPTSLPLAALLAIACLGAARTALESRRRSASPPVAADPAPAGRWRELRMTARFALGELSALELHPAGGGTLSIPRGAVREDTLVRFPGSADRRRVARGPRDVEPDAPRTLVDLDELRRVAPPRAGPWIGALTRQLAALRGAIERRIKQLPLRSDAARGLAAALLVGETSSLDPELTDRFTRTGTRHVLAVSGLHVGLAATLVVGPLAWLVAHCLRQVSGRRRRGRPRGRAGARPIRPASPRIKVEAIVCLTSIVAIALMAAIAGGRPPVTRAALALGLAGLTPLLAARRRADARTLWGVALTLELLRDPLAVQSLGVQLSYTATLAILLGCAPLAARLRTALSNPLDRSSGVWLHATSLRRALAVRAVGCAATALAASLAATLGTLPIVWTQFGECSPVGMLATPLVVPFIGWCLVTGWAAVVGLAPCGLFDAGCELCMALLAALDSLPGTPLPLPPRPPLLIAAAAALLFVGLLRSPPALRAGYLLSGLLLLPWTVRPPGVQVVALDVGHGTAVIVESPAQTWVFDAGSRDALGVGRAVARELAAREVRRPSYFVSHTDRDHVGALPWLVDSFPPRLWVGAALDRSAPGAHLQPAPRAARWLTQCIDIDSGRLRLPTRGPGRAYLVRGAPLAGNEGSRTLSISGVDLAAGNASPAWIHLSGDAERAGLAPVLDRGHLTGPTRLLLFPHHGSDGPYVGRLLSELQPEEIWISCPDPGRVAQELDRRGLPWRSTGCDGPLELELPEESRGSPGSVGEIATKR